MNRHQPPFLSMIVQILCHLQDNVLYCMLIAIFRVVSLKYVTKMEI